MSTREWSTALSLAAMAFLITIVLGYPYLSYLRRAGLGKKVRPEGPYVLFGYSGGGNLAFRTAVELERRGKLVSDVIQVVHFKRTGRRVFLMAPVHHHFEKLGWPESRIVVRFWIVSFACAILGLLLVLKVR